MNFHVMTLFPEMIENVMNESITGRAIKAGHISLNAVNIRDFAENKHNRVDDYPYGGGAGMVMQAGPVYRCYESILSQLNSSSDPDTAKNPVRVVYLTPQGQVFEQSLAKELSQESDLILLCGHYEGIDERVLEEIVTDYVSIGDYVLTGGELPACVMMDAIARLIPGVLNNDDSALTESHSSEHLLEYPQYTRPAIWHEKEVPPVLLSGHHKNLQAWYREQSVIRTALRRPDMLKDANLSSKEQELVRSILEGNSDE